MAELGDTSAVAEADLDDFMDIVTVFKCKFCDFSCNDRTGMSNHVRSYHIVIGAQTNALRREPAGGMGVSLLSGQLQPLQTVSYEGSVAAGTKPGVVAEEESIQVAVLSNTQDTQLQIVESTNNKVEQTTVTASAVDMAACKTDMATDTVSLDSGQDVIEITELNGQDVVLIPNTGLPNDSVPVNKEVYLCGQCNLGFDSIDDCKTHMIKDHIMNVGTAGSQEDSGMETQAISDDFHIPLNRVSVGTQVMTRKKPGRKRKPKEPQHIPRMSLEEEMEEEEAAAKEERVQEVAPEVEEELGRRRRRPPKMLTQLYYLGKKKAKKPPRTKPEPHKVKCSKVFCNARFRTQTSLAIHLSCHKSSNREEKSATAFSCPTCNLEVDQWKVLRLHLWRDHNIDTDLYSCEECDFKTDSFCKLDRHAQIHGDARPFTCDICKKAFKQATQLRNHKIIHADREGDPSKWYTNKQCDICKRTFANQKCLKNHIEAIHSKEKPFLCPYCGHATSRKAILELHVRTHTGEKPYKCNQCSYATGDHNSLRRHKMRHTGEKPYKCRYCQYSAIQAISLKTHMKNKHPGSSGIYACDLCQYRTVNEQSYHHHMDDHRHGLIATVTTPSSNLGAGAQTWSEKDTEMAVSQITTQPQITTRSDYQEQIQTQTIQVQGPADAFQGQISPFDLSKLASMEMVHGNINAAQLVYSALNAISQQSVPQPTEMTQTEVDEASSQELQPTVQSTTQDGVTTHTITFRIPQSQEQQGGPEGEVLLAVAPQDMQEGAVDLDGRTITYTTEVVPDMTEVVHHKTGEVDHVIEVVPEMTEVVHNATEVVPQMTQVVHHIEELQDQVVCEAAPVTSGDTTGSELSQHIVINMADGRTATLVADGQTHYVTATQS